MRALTPHTVVQSPTAYGTAQALQQPRHRSATLDGARSSGSAAADRGFRELGSTSPRGLAARAGSATSAPLSTYASPAEREQAEAYFSDLLSYRRGLAF